MTAMFIWRDESGAPCIIVKNALDHKGCDNLIKQLKVMLILLITSVVGDMIL